MYDLIIKNGKIYDGDGGEPYIADVAIKNGRITKISSNILAECKAIDASGLAVTPGFIDSHSHSDRDILTFPLMREKLEQGITTAVAGQCGSSAAPIDLDYRTDPDYASRLTIGSLLDAADGVPQGMSTLTFVGHSTLRRAVMGMANRHATDEELSSMKALLSEALDAGAIGLSFGLYYTPGSYADRRELVELARVVGERGALLSAHIRNEGSDLVGASREYIEIIKESGVRHAVHSHLKAAGTAYHGSTAEVLKLIEEANREGYDIHCDVYPYVASHTTLSARYTPKEMRADGRLVENMTSPETREYTRNWIAESFKDHKLSTTLIVFCPAYPEYQGLNLEEIADLRGEDVKDAIMNILRDSPNTSAAFFSMSEDEVTSVISHPLSMFCTDSGVGGNKTMYHPRLRASFTRVLARYVRERGVLTLPEAIRKMTSLPASVYRLTSKGRIAEGYDADICIFSPEKILDVADFKNTTARSEGLSYVIVGGEVAVVDGIATGKKCGKILRAKN